MNNITEDICLTGTGTFNVSVVEDYDGGDTLTVNGASALDLDISVAGIGGVLRDSQAFTVVIDDGVSTPDVSGQQDFNTRTDDGARNFALNLDQIGPDPNDVEVEDFDGSFNAGFDDALGGTIGSATSFRIGAIDVELSLDRAGIQQSVIPKRTLTDTRLGTFN